MTTYDDSQSDWWRGNRAIGEVTDVPIAADHDIWISNPSDQDYSKKMGIVSVDDAAKTVTVKFGGAFS